MPIDFPSSPTTGQVYTYQGKSWVYNGTGWDSPRALSEIGAVQTFANAAARTAAIPTPTEGIVTYLNDVDRLDIHNGTAFAPAIGTGAWIAYTPTLTGITIGNGTVTAKYSRVGKTVNVSILIVLGSTSSITGIVQVGIPLTRAANTVPNTTISFDDTNVAIWPGFAFEAASVIQCLALLANGTYAAQAGTSATVPFTWGSGDKINVATTYETSAA
jgi:hypothetical protein